MDSTNTTATLPLIATPDKVAQPQEVTAPAEEATTAPAAIAEDPAVESSEEGTPAAPTTPLLEAEADAQVEEALDQAVVEKMDVGVGAQGGDDEAEASSQEDVDQADDEGSKKRKREESDDPSQAAEESDAQPPEDDATKELEAEDVDDDEQAPPSKRQAVGSPEDPQLELNGAPKSDSETEPEVEQEGPKEDKTNCAAEEAELPATPVLAGKVLMAEADEVRSEALKVEE
jgi:hypothetical protein